jgi:hypothetical protein
VKQVRGYAGERSDRATGSEREIQLDTHSALARDNLERIRKRGKIGWCGESNGKGREQARRAREIVRYKEWRMRSGAKVFILPRRR